MPGWAIAILAGCGGIFVLAVLVIVLLTIVGSRVSPVFSNVTDGLRAFPTPTP